MNNIIRETFVTKLADILNKVGIPNKDEKINANYDNIKDPVWLKHKVGL